jgi:hypothetical protein
VQDTRRTDAFLAGWRKAFEAVKHETSRMAGSAMPVRVSGDDPFGFPGDIRHAVDVLGDAENPARSAAFMLVWHDWSRSGGRAGQDAGSVTALARAVLESLASNAGLAAEAVNCGAGSGGRGFAEKKAIAVHPRGQAERPEWRAFIELWRSAAWNVVEVSGSDAEVPAIWRSIGEQTVSVVLSCDGSAASLSWSVPYCGCADLCLGNPGQAPVREQWLPGYVAIGVEGISADSLRKTLPQDVPVFSMAPGKSMSLVDAIAAEMCLKLGQGRWH